MESLSRILIVDDDPDIRNVLCFLLKDKYNVSQAQDGPAALAHLRDNPDTDLVVLDVMMPGMSGYEVCTAIREFSYTSVGIGHPIIDVSRVAPHLRAD